MVDTDVSSVLRMNYAVVMDEPSSSRHSIEQQASFTLEVLDGTSRVPCTYARFAVGYDTNDETWHAIPGGTSNTIWWKEWTTIGVNLEDYDGKTIILNQEKNMVLDPEEYPVLNSLCHHELITTDGTTLLGADDKAGIAIIMQLVEYLQQHPEFKHNDIQVAFTPDEEVGRGTENFDVQRFNADYAYTIDGGDIADVEYENFNAFSANIEIHGKSIHPGSAKNKMINSIRVAQEFDAMLPVHARPESTEGYEGFNHLHSIQGNCEKTVIEYFIRNHDLALAKKQCQDFIDIADYLNKKYQYQIAEVKITQSYLNMKEILKDHMYIVDQAKQAINEGGISATSTAIRGGTDGVRLTYLGLPCPNLGTGGFNYHGPYEFVSVTMMEQQVEMLIRLLSANK